MFLKKKGGKTLLNVTRSAKFVCKSLYKNASWFIVELIFNYLNWMFIVEIDEDVCDLDLNYPRILSHLRFFFKLSCRKDLMCFFYYKYKIVYNFKKQYKHATTSWGLYT